MDSVLTHIGEGEGGGGRGGGGGGRRGGYLTDVGRRDEALLSVQLHFPPVL